MVKSHLVKFWVSEEDFEKIKLNAQAKGHNTISAYLRELSLNKDMRMETLLVEIHNEVVKNAGRG